MTLEELERLMADGKISQNTYGHVAPKLAPPAPVPYGPPAPPPAPLPKQGMPELPPEAGPAGAMPRSSYSAHHAMAPVTAYAEADKAGPSPAEVEAKKAALAAGELQGATKPTGGPVEAPAAAAGGPTPQAGRTFLGTAVGGGGGRPAALPKGIKENFDRFKKATIEANEAQLEAELDQKLLAQQAADRGRERGVERAEEYRAQALGIQRFEEERRTKEEQRMLRVEAESSELKKLTEQYGKSSIDNGRVWKNNSTAQNVMHVIAAMFMGFAGGGKGNPMAGIQYLNGLVDRDVEAQKHDTSVKGERLKQRRGLYADMLDRYKDERLAELATKNAMLEQGKYRIAEMAERQGGEESSEKVSMAMAELTKQQASNQMAFAERMYTLEQQPGGSAFVPRATGGGGGAGLRDAKMAEFLSKASPGDKMVLNGKVYVKTPGGNIVESEDAGKAELHQKNSTVNSGHKAELLAEITGLKRGRHIISGVPVSDNETLPGLGLGAKVADTAAKVLGDNPGRYQSNEGKAVNGVMQNAFSSFKQVGENSDADAERIKERMRGDGTKKGVLRNFDEMILKKEQELEALHGQPVTEQAPTPQETERAR